MACLAWSRASPPGIRAVSSVRSERSGTERGQANHADSSTLALLWQLLDAIYADSGCRGYLPARALITFWLQSSRFWKAYFFVIFPLLDRCLDLWVRGARVAKALCG
jgi:hypothetical protein